MAQAQSITETWDSYTGQQNPAEFMDISRQRLGADVTTETAARAYVAEAYADWQRAEDAWNANAEVNGEETRDLPSADDLSAALTRYLDATRGETWDIATPTSETSESSERSGVTNQVWQHKTSGDQFVVAVEPDGRLWGACGPVYHGDIVLADLGDWDIDPMTDDERAEMERARADYRVLSDDEIRAIEMQHAE